VHQYSPDVAPAVPEIRAAPRPRLWPRFETALPLLGFVALFVASVAGMAGRAASKPLWHDEIFTLYLATRTSVAGLWRSLASGVDLNPPLYYLAVRAASDLFGAGAFATRFPALIGFLIASLAIYAFVRRRVGSYAATIAAATPALTHVSIYAYEGRPYGLVLGLSALAVLAWQVRDRGRGAQLAPLLCFLAVAGAILAHYYAVLVLFPLAVGEIVRVIRRRSIDWAMWAALALSPFAVLTVWPLVAAARQFAPTFWSPPSPGDVLDAYRLILEPLALPAFAAALATFGVGLAFTRRSRGDVEVLSPISKPPLEEVALVLALVALPVAGFVLAVGATGAFHERYVLQAVLGVSILAGWWSASLLRSRFTSVVAVATILLVLAARQASGAVALAREAPDPLASQRWALIATPGDAPLVVSHALTYLPLAHYLSESGDSRVIYLTRPPDVVQRLGSDTSGRALGLLSHVVGLDVQPYEAFVRAHPQFYVYGPKSWLVPKLLRDSASLRLVRESGDDMLYSVDMNGAKEPDTP